jgi:hypothetical protein
LARVASIAAMAIERFTSNEKQLIGIRQAIDR